MVGKKSAPRPIGQGQFAFWVYDNPQVKEEDQLIEFYQQQVKLYREQGAYTFPQAFDHKACRARLMLEHLEEQAARGL